MHKKMLEDATSEQLKYIVDIAMLMVKRDDEELYEELEMRLYKEIYGCHFTEWLLHEALDEMKNQDGTKGGHWSLESTDSVARTNGISFEHFNRYDFNYVMNMIYSDYYGAISNETNAYFKLAKAFLMDKDASKGKALKYYLKVSKEH